MAEYIDRKKAEILFRDARLALKPEGCKDWNEYITRDTMLMNAEQLIHIFPAADVRPVVRGRWEKGTGENGVTTSLFCSVCHYENRHWHEWNYCPNCGCAMEVDK